MDMKPEYSYGTFSHYTLRLHTSDIGDNPEAVVAVLGKYYDGFAANGHEILRERTEKKGELITDFAYSYQVEKLFAMKNGLEAAGANCILEEEKFCTILPPATINAANEEFLHTIFRFQERLNHGAEFALDKWALDNGIVEAYRIYRHQSYQATVTRIWWQDGKIWIYDAVDRVRKRLMARLLEKLDVEPKPLKPPITIEPTEIESFRLWMQDNFWKQKAWQQEKIKGLRGHPPTYFVEGWYYGAYKVEFVPAGYSSNNLVFKLYTVLHPIIEKHFGYRR